MVRGSAGACLTIVVAAACSHSHRHPELAVTVSTTVCAPVSSSCPLLRIPNAKVVLTGFGRQLGNWTTDDTGALHITYQGPSGGPLELTASVPDWGPAAHATIEVDLPESGGTSAAITLPAMKYVLES